MIVTDTGPLIAFSRIRGLPLLQQVVRELVIPEAVYNELVGTGRERPGAQEVEYSTWIQRRAVTDLTTLALLPTYLHRGEQEALVLARELSVDHRAASNICCWYRQGLGCSGARHFTLD
jgi:predicted nucleic acid-binding protein